MAGAWITEIHNSWDKTYHMWCTNPPGPSAHLGVFDGKDYGNAKVPIPPGKRYQGVEWCAIPWYDGKHFRYLSGPGGTVRMHSGAVRDADRVVFVDDATSREIGDMPIGSASSGSLERVSLALVIDNKGVKWEVRDSSRVATEILTGLAAAALSLAPELLKALATKKK